MKRPDPKPESAPDDLLPEYDFNYSKAKPNRFAAGSKRRSPRRRADKEGNAQSQTGR